MTIILRQEKGSPLTFDDLDNNFIEVESLTDQSKASAAEASADAAQVAIDAIQTTEDAAQVALDVIQTSADAVASSDSAQQAANDAASANGNPLGAYANNITFNSHNDYVSESGLFRLKESINTPYTTNTSTYPLATDDPNLAPWSSVDELETVAISLNTPRANVTYDGAGEVLTGFVYSPSQGVTYAVPVDAQGKGIKSVVGNVLETGDLTLYALESINKSGVEFNVIADIDNLQSAGGKLTHLLIGDSLTVLDYATGNNSGVLFFKVVAAATGTADGGKFIDLPTLGLQLEQNIKTPLDPKAWGTKTGVDASTSVINTFAYSTGQPVEFTPMDYLISQELSLDGLSFSDIKFQSGARILCGANNLTVFKSAVNAWGVKIVDPDIRGNGFTGCTAFDVIRLEQLGAGIFRPVLRDLDTGIFLRSLCTGCMIDDPDIQNTTSPIKIQDGSGGITVNHPRIDSFGNIGIHLMPAISFGNIGVNITGGGYIQNGGEGIRDEDGVATQISGVYFETCTVADIKLDTARFSNIDGTNHTSIGNVGIFSRNSDTVRVKNPFMSSGGRTIGLFDFDGTNTNCSADYSTGASSENLPVGNVGGIVNTNELSSGFTPIIKGTTTSGAATYAVQIGNYSKIGRQLHVIIRLNWSGHTGTGNMIIDGLPANVAITTPLGRVGMLHTGFSITGTSIATAFTGTDKEMAVYDYTANGSLSLVPMKASGAIDLCATFFLP